jgi:nucleoside-diphosphate-sugar epimerase
MHIAVTGGSGKLGGVVVSYLREQGHIVVNLDRQVPAVPDRFALPVDLTDFGQVVAAFSGVDERLDAPVDAIVHLAAIPAPGLTTNSVIFHNNLTITHNVFEAARILGIKNIVWASSETVLGIPLGIEQRHQPPYLPVDEDYDPRPEFHYAMAKALEEDMARYFCRWDPELKAIGLRFSNVMLVEDYAEYPSWQDDPSRRIWNLWSYIDARDGAQAVEKALAFNGKGTDIFVIANADTVMERPTESLVQEYFPALDVRGDISGRRSLLSIEKARRILGYEPQHSWRDHV